MCDKTIKHVSSEHLRKLLSRTNTVRESALKADSGEKKKNKKILATQGNRTRVSTASGFSVRRCTHWAFPPFIHRPYRAPHRQNRHGWMVVKTNGQSIIYPIQSCFDSFSRMTKSHFSRWQNAGKTIMTASRASIGTGEMTLDLLC